MANTMTPGSKLGREFSQLPITALGFLQAPGAELLLLAGEDGDLVVYAAESGLLVCRLADVLPEQPIHGIRVQWQPPQDAFSKGEACALALVWGSSLLALVSVPATGKCPRILARTRLLDRIYDAALSPWHEDHVAAVVTAHNEVCLVKFADDRLVAGLAVSPSRPMLFTARLAWMARNGVLVVGGTAFGEIVVWRCHVEDGAQLGGLEMVSVLTGHEGSIFGLDILPGWKGPQTPGEPSAEPALPTMLVSCSDDRTVRVWDIGGRGAGLEGGLARGFDEARETGFLAGPAVPTRPANEIASNMGHISRIWGVRFGPSIGAASLSSAGATSLAVYSFGEDASMQRWRLDLTVASASKDRALTAPSGTLTPIRNLSLHDGKHIWASAVVARPRGVLIATGGPDGKLSLVEDPAPNLPQARHVQCEHTSGIPAPVNQTVTLNMGDVIATLPAVSTIESTRGKEVISRYDFISDHELVATTSTGRLLACLMGLETLSWRQVEVAEPLKAAMRQCYVVKATGHGTAVLGTSCGTVLFHNSRHGLSLVTGLKGKIVEICVLSTVSRAVSAEKDVEVLVFFHGSSLCHKLDICPESGVLRRETAITELDGRFVATTAGLVGDLLFIGSRHGFMSVLRRVGSSYRVVLNTVSRSSDTICCIIPLPPKAGDASSYILTTHKDGMYRIYKIRNDGDKVELDLEHETAMPFGPVIAGAWFTSDPAPELIIYGFKSKDFILWNETRRRELASVDCGGAHRIFGIYQDRGRAGRLRFAFTKASTLTLYRQEAVSQRTVKPGTHGREIRCMSFNGKWLATGSEDTSIRLWEYKHDSGSGAQPALEYLATVKRHITGLHKVQWHGQDILCSSAGSEEFFVWRVRHLDAGYARLAVVCEAVFTDKTADGDLRIMDFDVSGHSTATADGALVITMAFSNSTIRTYRYERGLGFSLLARSSYTGACLTQARHVRFEDGVRAILTASTDGHVALWDFSFRRGGSKGDDGEARQHRLIQVARLHQSCIEGIDMAPCRDGFLVVTSGDDNALGWMRLDVTERQAGDEDGPPLRMSGQSIVRGAHAASINGALIHRAQGDGGLRVVSCSNDQRVKVWSMDENGSSVTLLRDIGSGVADPGDVCLVGGGSRAIVGGVGVEIWRLPG